MIDVVLHVGLFCLADASAVVVVFPVLRRLTTRSGGYCVCHLNILHISVETAPNRLFAVPWSSIGHLSQDNLISIRLTVSGIAASNALIVF